MLHSSVVASAAHAALAALNALMLQRAATTRAARRLALTFALFAGYSLTIGLGYASVDHQQRLAFALFEACLVFACASSVALARFLLARFAEARDTPLVWLLALGSLALFVASLATGGGWAYPALGALSLVAMLLGIGLAFGLRRRASERDRRALRSYLIASAIPLLPLVLDLLNSAGLPVPWYRLIRNLAVMGSLYGLLAALLNDGVQVISLRTRALGGTMTLALVIVVVVAELVAPAGGEGAHAVSARLLALTAALLIAVPLLVRHLYRRTFIEPLERLVDAVSSADPVQFEPIDVELRDEVGVLTESFNEAMRRLEVSRRELQDRLRELAQRNEQVEELNEELRWQLTSRSKDLANLALAVRPDPALAPGQLLGGRYRVLGELGRGGMGVVLRVARVRDDKELALKLVHEPDATAAARFAREAEVAVKLTGPNLVSVVDVGITDGRPFLVMELVPGGSLEDQRDRFGEIGWAIDVLHQIAKGLMTIHGRGVVHRDLKPANVLMAAGDQGAQIAKISDFGIAKERIDALAATVPLGSERRLTATGAIMGTLLYVAPELIERGVEVTPAVDVFAFGLIGWELLGGAFPFAVPPFFTVASGAPLPSPTPLPVDVPPDVERLLRRCLAERPWERPTAREIVEGLATASGAR